MEGTKRKQGLTLAYSALIAGLWAFLAPFWAMIQHYAGWPLHEAALASQIVGAGFIAVAMWDFSKVRDEYE